MAKYVCLYYIEHDSDAGDDAAWGAFFGQLGEKLVDGGNPFAHGGKAVSKDGVMDVQGAPVTGYTIVSADSMEAATALMASCPVVAGGGVVCVYEALPM